MMATDISDIAKQGYLKVRSRKLGLWQRRWIILRRASSKGPCRLEKYLDEKSARTFAGHKTSLLNSICSVCRLPSSIKKYAFSLCFLDNTTKCLACDSDMDAENWVKLLIQETIVPQPGLATGEPDILSTGIQKELQEQFHVYLMPTPKLEVFGECLLQVTHENIYLWDINNSRLKLVSWPLTALRRYGSDPSKFTFEAGRQCATGEGMFVFHTLEGDKIYCKVHQATLAIAEAHLRMKEHREQNFSNKVSPSSSSQSLSFPSGFSESMSHIKDKSWQKPALSNLQNAPEQSRMKCSQEAFLPENIQRPRSKCSLRSHLLQCGSNPS